MFFFFSSRRRHTRCALVTGVQTCALPNLNVLGHEGNWSPDGKTFWATGTAAGSITAIDVSNPASPKIVYTGLQGFPANHGVEFTADGNTMYLSTCLPGGVVVLDVSDIQSRKAVPMIRQIGSVSWNALSCAQHALPVTWHGKPYLTQPDEFNSEGLPKIGRGE